MPEGQQYPDFGQCVHKLVMAADGGEHLYQQNHCGVYRSTDGGKQGEEATAKGAPTGCGFPVGARPPDGGKQWEGVTANGLPTEFGFRMAAHPRDPKTAWTIPLTEPQDGRM